MSDFSPKGSALSAKGGIQVKIRTLFIGIISDIEDKFGYLWGHDREELTENQMRFYDLWQELRKDILDRGNATLRKVESELNGPSMVVDEVKQRYYYKMKVKGG